MPILISASPEATSLLPSDNPASPYSYYSRVSSLFERGQKRRWRLDSCSRADGPDRGPVSRSDPADHSQVKQDFTNLVLAKATLKLAQDNLSSFRHELQINHDRYNAGDIGELDYERLDLQLAQFESDESSAETNLVQASDQLQTLIGINNQPAFDISGDLVPPTLSAHLTELERKARRQGRTTERLKRPCV